VGDQGSGQQASTFPAAASSDAVPEHISGGLEKDLRMQHLPFDSTCLLTAPAGLFKLVWNCI
jgi:hypothetical protein